MNVEDSTGSDIDRASAAGAVQDGRHDQLEGFLGSVRTGRRRRSARQPGYQPPPLRVHFAGRRAPLQDQVRRRQRRTSREKDHTQSTEASPLLRPTLINYTRPIGVARGCSGAAAPCKQWRRSAVEYAGRVSQVEPSGASKK